MPHHDYRSAHIDTAARAHGHTSHRHLSHRQPHAVHARTSRPTFLTKSNSTPHLHERAERQPRRKSEDVRGRSPHFNQEVMTKYGLSKRETERLLKCKDFSYSVMKPSKKRVSNLPRPVTRSENLRQLYPQLDRRNSRKILNLLDATGSRLYISNTHALGVGKVVFASSGTKNASDMLQNAKIFAGANGHKMNALQDLCRSMREHEIRPDIYTGASLGGAIAVATFAYMNYHGQSSRDRERQRRVYVFDAAPVNEKIRETFHISTRMLHRGKKSPVVNTYMASNFSLHSIASKIPWLKVPDGISLETENRPNGLANHQLKHIGAVLQRKLTKNHR